VEGLGICCSGGGIRSAAFNLGALQALAAAGVYQQAEFVTAVSGGSYMAASFATVLHAPRFDDEQVTVEPPKAPDYPYSPGSAEERHLRNHSHYLFPRLGVTARGVLGLAFGIMANLGLLLVGVFVGARVLGWLLRGQGVLTGLSGTDPQLHLPLTWWVWAPAFVGAALVLMFGENLLEVYYRPRTVTVRALRTVAGRLAVTGLLLVVALIGLPAAAVGLHRLALTNSPNPTTAYVLARAGFASATGCAQAAQTSPDGACGAERGDPADAVANAEALSGKGFGQTLTTVLAFLAALVMVVRRFVRLAGGLVGGRDAAPERRSAFGQLLQAGQRRLLAWLGSGLGLAGVTVLAISWLNGAATRGFGWPELALVGGALVLFAALKTFTDINRTSLHPYYREQLASAYTVRRVRTGDRVVAEPVPYQQPLSLSKVDPTVSGVDGPELVICAAANITDESVPPGRGCVSFTFTGRDVGLAAGRLGEGRLPVAQYEQVAGPRRVTLPAAVAVSAAAVSPLAGKSTVKSQRLLLALANVRLGLWLPNPLRCPPAPATTARAASLWRRVVAQWRQPGAWRLLTEIAGRTHLGQRWLYITDGGHFDNLGLVEALRRQPRTVFAFDASGDAVDSWSTIGEAVGLARTELGVHVELDPTEMHPQRDNYVRTPYARGQVWYPPVDRHRPADATLWVAKLGVTEAAPWDVRAYAAGSARFPCDPTFEQLYGGQQLEAYRALGQASTEQLLDAFRQEQAAPAPIPGQPSQPGQASQPDPLPPAARASEHLAQGV
jgi:hypothetical protein